MPEEYDEDGNVIEGQPQQESPRFSMPSVFPQNQSNTPEPEPEQEEAHESRPNPDDAALDDEDVEEIFGTGERGDGTTDEIERTDFSDILDVDESDITGDKPVKPKQRFSRTVKRFIPNNPPPASLGGMQY